jgi:ketosteroid isomerase-like protein
LNRSYAQRFADSLKRWNSGDHDAPVDEIHPEAEIHTMLGDGLAGEPYRGPAGAQRWLESLDENFERWEIHADEFEERGEVVIGKGRIRALTRTSGVELAQDVSWYLRFSDDMVVYMRVFFDRDEASRFVE